MNPITVIGLFFDGAQVLFGNIKIISALSANIIGIGAWILLGISANRADKDWRQNGVAFLSMGICGFVLVSYAIVAISSIWHLALPILSNGLLIFSLLGIVLSLFRLLKKKTSPVDSATSSFHSLLLR